MRHLREGWRLFREDLRHRIPPEMTFAIASLALALALLVATGFRVG